MVRLLKRVAAGALLGLFLLPGAARSAEVVWHGYAQHRFYSPQGGAARFRVDRVSLSATAQIDPNTTAYVEWYFHNYVAAVSAAEPYRTYLESAYADFKLPVGTLRVGKGRRMAFAITPSYPARKLSNYGIFSEAFTQDRAQGIQYFVNAPDKGYEAGIALLTGMRIGNRGIGDVTLDGTNTVKSLADRDVPHDINESLQVDAKLGLLNKSGARVGITGSLGHLDRSDLDFLNGTETVGSTTVARFAGPHTSRTHNRYGAYFTYPWKDYIAQGMYIQAKTSDIKHAGFELLAGYSPKGMKPKAYVRYAGVDIDIPVTASQYTWDKRQLGLSVVKPLKPTVWLQFEYERNMESQPAGTPKVKNDLAFVEIFTGF
ncbi:MAG: hypothetical protein KatS3mg024_0928 [Armatimonadota bacterium]|nr:MAG: hypothetical protein KatS3mg024_0928 [Armatimonadota bacterium]